MSDRTKEEIIENINHIVANNIQPGVEMHGGVVKLKDFDMETGVALMLMSGACSGCASSSVTLKLGVENMLKHYVPEVNAVEGVDDPEYNDPYYKEMPAYNSWENPGKSYDEMLDEMEQIEKEDKPNENDGS
jgi:Fe-S cluster biogenesis protein NfuA|tara:strand:- start:754 stop:1149 length:396 start_codon:yes stop_codon:yes gene_type:complete